MEILQKILDHFRDYVVGLLLILPLKSKIGFRITYRKISKIITYYRIVNRKLKFEKCSHTFKQRSNRGY